MGSDISKEVCFQNPAVDERNLDSLRNYLCNYSPPRGCVDYINILLFGMVGAGKSSIINTFLSALDPQGATIPCVPTGNNPGSLTPELRCYREGSLKFWDTTGWNALEDTDRTKRLLQMILEGRIPNQTNLHSLNTDSDVSNYPIIPENVIHGVAFICDMNTIDSVSKNEMNLFQELQTIVAQKYIYRVVIGTKFELLGIKQKDHKEIYECKPLKDKFKLLSDLTGMEKHSMFVVSNQWGGDQIQMVKCILVPYALENMIRNIDKFLKVTQ